MRYHEILEAAAPRIPARYLIDPETDLALNAEGQWSRSPYLGAVKSSTGSGYVAQIHIPQAVWVAMVQQNPHKWSGHAPETFFNEVGNQRPPMRVAFADPRQAAYFAQEVLYGGDWDTKDVIEDYFEQQYLGGQGEIWQHIKSQVPQYEGKPLGADDEETYFADPEAFNSRREAAKKAQTQAKNASNYEPEMLKKIKSQLSDFYVKNPKLAQKRLGIKFKHRSQLEQVINDVVDSLGVNYFVTAPGSVKFKDLASLPLKA